MNRYIIYFLPDMQQSSIPIEADMVEPPTEEWEFVTFYRGTDPRTAEPVAAIKHNAILYYLCTPIPDAAS